MERWQSSLRKAVTDPDVLAKRFGLDPDVLRKISAVFPFRIPPHYLSLIRKKGDAVFRQCVPDERELEKDADLTADPLGEEQYSPVPGIVHRYPDHCLFLVSNQCAMYCRFCTRKRQFRDRSSGGIPLERIRAGIDYIRKTPAIRDVLVSGGDPFLLSDDRIEYILKGLRAIRHVEIIRIGTRTPCVLPERITRRLTSMLKRYHPLYINVHFNHPDELNAASVNALKRLADAGIPLGCQTVLLKGVNDDPDVIRKLMEKLLAARVRPYYLLQTDLIYGIPHFRTPLRTGIGIMDHLRGSTSGLAVPHFIVDLPGGGGKIELLPEYLVKRDGLDVTFRNSCGKLCAYHDVP